MMKVDAHIHSSFSDGRASVSQIVNKALELELDVVAVVDHVRADSEWVDDFVSEVDKFRAKFHRRIDVLCGLEAKCLDFSGNVDIPKGAAAKVDLVVGAIHRIPSGEGFIPSSEIGSRREEALQCWEKSVSAMLENPDVVMWAHPGALLVDNGIEIPEAVSRRLVAKAVEHGKFIETNKKRKAPSGSLLKAVEEAKIELIPGSDAHSLQEMMTYSVSCVCSKAAARRLLSALEI
jgi:putative hydrolase